jgi:hypothetical protein
MKAKKRFTLYCIVLFILCNTIRCIAQTQYGLTTNPQIGILYQGSANNAIGINYKNSTFTNPSPSAKLHLQGYQDALGDLPVFLSEAWSRNTQFQNPTLMASFQSCGQVANQLYGIYQWGLQGWQNYLESPTTIGDPSGTPSNIFTVNGGSTLLGATIGNSGTLNTNVLQVNGLASFCSDLNLGICGMGPIYSSQFTFHCPYIVNFDVAVGPEMSKMQGPNNYLFSLSYASLPTATVSGKLITQTFQLTDGAGLNNVLVSDALGNGSWTDLSGIMDYWQPISGNICLNPKYNNVGIGTEAPLDKLQVNDGTSKIVLGIGPENVLSDQQSKSKAMAITGPGYFGFNTSYSPITGQWLVSGNGTTNAGV